MCSVSYVFPFLIKSLHASINYACIQLLKLFLWSIFIANLFNRIAVTKLHKLQSSFQIVTVVIHRQDRHHSISHYDDLV